LIKQDSDYANVSPLPLTYRWGLRGKTRDDEYEYAKRQNRHERTARCRRRGSAELHVCGALYFIDSVDETVRSCEEREGVRPIWHIIMSRMPCRSVATNSHDLTIVTIDDKLLSLSMRETVILPRILGLRRIRQTGMRCFVHIVLLVSCIMMDKYRYINIDRMFIFIAYIIVFDDVVHQKIITREILISRTFYKIE